MTGGGPSLRTGAPGRILQISYKCSRRSRDGGCLPRPQGGDDDRRRCHSGWSPSFVTQSVIVAASRSALMRAGIPRISRRCFSEPPSRYQASFLRITYSGGATQNAASPMPAPVSFPRSSQPMPTDGGEARSPWPEGDGCGTSPSTSGRPQATTLWNWQRNRNRQGRSAREAR